MIRIPRGRLESTSTGEDWQRRVAMLEADNGFVVTLRGCRCSGRIKWMQWAVGGIEGPPVSKCP